MATSCFTLRIYLARRSKLDYTAARIVHLDCTGWHKRADFDQSLEEGRTLLAVVDVNVVGVLLRGRELVGRVQQILHSCVQRQPIIQPWLVQKTLVQVGATMAREANRNGYRIQHRVRQKRCGFDAWSVPSRICLMVIPGFHASSSLRIERQTCRHS